MADAAPTDTIVPAGEWPIPSLGAILVLDQPAHLRKVAAVAPKTLGDLLPTPAPMPPGMPHWAMTAAATLVGGLLSLWAFEAIKHSDLFGPKTPAVPVVPVKPDWLSPAPIKPTSLPVGEPKLPVARVVSLPGCNCQYGSPCTCGDSCDCAPPPPKPTPPPAKSPPPAKPLDTPIYQPVRPPLPPAPAPVPVAPARADVLPATADIPAPVYYYPVQTYPTYQTYQGAACSGGSCGVPAGRGLFGRVFAR